MVMQGWVNGGKGGEGEVRAESESPESLFKVSVIIESNPEEVSHEKTFVCNLKARYAGISIRRLEKKRFKCARGKVVVMCWHAVTRLWGMVMTDFFCKKEKHFPLVMHAHVSFSKLPSFLKCEDKEKNPQKNLHLLPHYNQDYLLVFLKLSHRSWASARVHSTQVKHI